MAEPTSAEDLTVASGSEGDHAENVPLTGGASQPPTVVREATEGDAVEQREEVSPRPAGIGDLAGSTLPDDAPVADVLEQAQEVGFGEDDYR